MTEPETIRMTRRAATTGDAPGDLSVPIPRQLGSVRLIRELGRGGMGVVWLGRDQFLGRDVAVKLLLGARASPSDPAFTTFLEGARAAAAVKGPGLNMIHHAGVVEGVPYLVLELIDGPSLHELIARTDQLQPATALFVLHAVCESVAVLHESGITHRDIKPANILLDADARPVLTDFGLAILRRFGDAAGSTSGVAGTPAYMAPEMFDGHVAPRSDVYALGILAFELFTGSLPFSGSPVELCIQHGTVDLPEEPLAPLHPALADAIRRATNKKPRLRYRSAAHFARALEAARPDDLPEPAALADLRRRVARCRGLDDAPAPTPTTTGYYQALSSAAAQKQAGSSQLASAGDAPQAPARPGLPFSIECLRCNYDLRGLLPTGACPECGTPIATSLPLDRLMFADPRWLRLVIRGQRLSFVGAACWFLNLPVFAALYGLGAVTPATASGKDPADLGLVPAAAYVGLAALIPILSLIGVWLFTRVEPSPSPTTPNRSRLLARWGLVVVVILLAPASLPFWGASPIAQPVIGPLSKVFPIGHLAEVARPLLEVARPLLEVTLLLTTVALARYLRSLTRRIPNPAIARSAHTSSIVATVLLALWIILAPVRFIPALRPASGSLSLSRIMAATLSVFALIHILIVIGAASRPFRAVLRRAVPHPTRGTEIPTCHSSLRTSCGNNVKILRLAIVGSILIIACVAVLVGRRALLTTSTFQCGPVVVTIRAGRSLTTALSAHASPKVDLTVFGTSYDHIRGVYPYCAFVSELGSLVFVSTDTTSYDVTLHVIDSVSTRHVAIPNIHKNFGYEFGGPTGGVDSVSTEGQGDLVLMTKSLNHANATTVSTMSGTIVCEEEWTYDADGVVTGYWKRMGVQGSWERLK